MTITVLSPIVANQIAAGEVVERPASVVKELVENSLDAGATEIKVFIEQGGSRLIQVVDNGSGIAQAELALALQRHATSKLHAIEDLDKLASFGFRGEALATLAATSRLTLTSKTAEQTEAWQIFCEPQLPLAGPIPVAHPTGTCVKVQDLFFNTPARKKFLRSEKTEFAQIDEVLRRLALSHPTQHFWLAHNQRALRHYRAVSPGASEAERLISLCGKKFAQQAKVVSWREGQWSLTGWVSDFVGVRGPQEIYYLFVNGRSVKDRLLTHAVHRAYQSVTSAKQQLPFVLFLTLPADQVDVNVHPTKQEIRFRAGRLIHHFVYQAIQAAFEAQPTAMLIEAEQSPPGTTVTVEAQPHQQQQLPPALQRPSQTGEALPQSFRRALDCEASTPSVENPFEDVSPQRERPLRQSEDDTLLAQSPMLSSTYTPNRTHTLPALPLRRVVGIWRQQFALLDQGEGLGCLALNRLAQAWFNYQLSLSFGAEKKIDSVALLSQVRLSLDDLSPDQISKVQAFLSELSLENQLEKEAVILLIRVPKRLYRQPLAKLLPPLLRQFATDSVQKTEWRQWFVAHFSIPTRCWTLTDAITLLNEVEQHAADLLSETGTSPCLMTMALNDKLTLWLEANLNG